MTARYGLVVRAYPAEYRRRHGDELLATAIELHPDAWSARQAGSLLVGGLRTRAAIATGRSARTALVGGVRVAVFLYLVALTGGPLVHLLGLTPEVTYTASTVFLLAPLLPAAVLTITSRWPAAVAVSLLLALDVVHAATADGERHRPLSLAAGVVFAVVVAAAAWWLARKGDGRPALRPIAAVGAVVAVLALAAVLSGSEGEILLLLSLGLVAVGLALVAVDPRLLVTGSACLGLTAVLFFSQWGPSDPRTMIAVVMLGLAAAGGVASRRAVHRLETAPY